MFFVKKNPRSLHRHGKIVGSLKTDFPAGRCPLWHLVPGKVWDQAFRGAGSRFRLETIGKGKPAHDLFRRILCPEIFQALVTVPFGQAAAIRGQQERTVGELRRFQTQQTIEIKLPGGGREQVRAPHHLRDPHPGIVHHHSQLVGKHAIGAAEVEIPAVAEQVLGVGAIQPSVKVMSSSGTMRR